ncbi:MAG: hypothetical protein U9Q71_06400, partial [Pseudomonadota bacterium]|nr:hypothetical protein [Pseudomonadota bacterium]
DTSESIVVRFQCSPHHHSHALYAVIQYLRSAAAIAEGDESDMALDKLSVIVRQAGLDAENTTLLLAGLLEIDTGPATAASPADPQQRKKILMTLVELLRGLAEVRPLLLVVEDLHWGDPTTVELLDRIILQTPTLPLLVVASYRPGFESRWLDNPHVHLLHLSRMDVGQSRSLAQQVAGKPLPEVVLEKIVDKTDGVPLFVEELTRTVLNSEWLLEERDGYRIAGGNLAFTIPETLRDSLMARLDSLGDARICAQAAAVIGREFEPELLAAISGDTPQSLDESLQQLADSGLVYPTVSGLRRTYMFKHALIQDTAYESLLKSQRQVMHQRLARFLEAERPEYAARQPDLLAHHYQHASEYLQAAQYWQQAGKQAIRQSAQQEAINHLETGLEALLRTPLSPQHDQLELATRLDLASCYRLTDRYDDALDCLSVAEQLATGLDRIEDLADIHYLRGNIYFPTGKLEGCLNQHNLSLDFARKNHSPEKEARAIGGLGDAYYLRRQMRSAAEQFTRCCSIAEQHGFLSLDSANRSMIGWSRLHLFEFNEALEDASLATSVARKCKNPRGEMMARALVCFTLGLLGEVERARKEGRAARQLAIKVGTSNFEAAVLYFQSEAADGEERRALLEDAMDKSRGGGITFHGPAILGALALTTTNIGKRKALWAEA